MECQQAELKALHEKTVQQHRHTQRMMEEESDSQEDIVVPRVRVPQLCMLAYQTRKSLTYCTQHRTSLPLHV